MNLGMPEILMILAVALLIFGPKKLPEMARGLGKAIREFQGAAKSVKTEFEKEVNEVKTAATEPEPTEPKKEG